jgi:hypothetical protein
MTISRFFRTASRLAVAALAVSAAACSAQPDGSAAEDQSEAELTSVTARSRQLKFDAYVYVERGASDQEILSAVRAQTQTAFGALRTAEIGVNSRELKDVAPKSFVKTNVTVIDTQKAGDAGTPMTRVKYRYTDSAVVPVSMARRSGLGIAVMSPSYQSQTSKILTECTDDDSEAREFQSSIWYVFNPSLAGCKAVMTKEQQAIDAETAKLSNTRTQVTKADVDRLYLPITVSLGADKTNKGASYPEYDRLYAGGVQKGAIVIGMVSGFIDHKSDDYTDSGYGEWMAQLNAAMGSRGISDGTSAGFKLVKSEPAEDISTFSVGAKKLTGLGFQDILAWETESKFPAGIADAQQADLRDQAGKKLIGHWLTFEADVEVKVGKAAETGAKIVIQTYFGHTESDIHKKAIKTSDVFIYNGHSQIGYGPLDPSNFSASDFPSSYQILFIDGCVSYNYYEKDYIPLKSGGTKNLDLITNGLEASAYRSGYAVGSLVSLLLDGTQHSYLDLLGAAEATDALRVVDGELDNKYSPTATPIVVR